MAIKPVVGYTGSGWQYPAAKTKSPTVYKPPTPAYNPLAYVPGGSSPAVGSAIQAKGFASPNVSIPSANSIVAPNSGAGAAASAPATDPYGNELTGDAMYGIGLKNYQDALDMGQRTLLHDPINQLIQAYGYDPRTTPGLPSNLSSIANQYLDPTGLDAARAGGYTTAQQIERGFGQALAGTPGNLATRGLERSGSSAIIGNRLNYDRGLQDKQAIDQLLSGIGTANQNWLDFQTQQANTWRQAQEDIATRRAQQQGYHGDQGVVPPESQDYSGGENAIFQPDPQTGALMAQDQAAGQWDSWANAMGNITAAANKPPANPYKPSTTAQQVIKKMRSSGETSAWEKAMQKLGG